MADISLTPETALQSAVVDALRSDAALAAMVDGNIFDEVPADAERPAPPWIYLGSITSALFDSMQGFATTVRIRVYCVSAEFGRLEAWAAAAAVRRVLHMTEPVLPAGFIRLDPLKAVQAGDVIGPDTLKQAFVDVEATIADDSVSSSPGL